MDATHPSDHAITPANTFPRRAVLRSLAVGGVGAALASVLDGERLRARTETTPGAPDAGWQEANRFVLADGETRFTYDATARQLTYESPSYPGRTFAGDEVHELRAEDPLLFFSRQVAVQLAVSQQGPLLLTLLLPRAGYAPDEEIAPMQIFAVAILTIHWQGEWGCDPGPCLGNRLRVGHEVAVPRGTAEVVSP